MTPSTRSSLMDCLSHILAKNPVLTYGMLLAPAVVASVSLKVSAALSLASLIILLPTLLALYPLSRILRSTLLVPVAAGIAAILYIPALMAVNYIIPNMVDKMGIYLPIITADVLLVACATELPQKRKSHFGWHALSVCCVMVGFCIVMLLLGDFREMAGSATLWEKELPVGRTAAVFLFPSFGFIIVAFLAVLVRVLTPQVVALFHRFFPNWPAPATEETELLPAEESSSPEAVGESQPAVTPEDVSDYRPRKLKRRKQKAEGEDAQ